jgi:hypothetical protein
MALISVIDLVHPPTPVFLPRSSRWCVGVDLGQSSDPTAIAVLENTRGVLDSNSAFERQCGIGNKPQVPIERIDVRHLERLPLGLSYPTVVQRVTDILGRAPLCGDDRTKPADLVIDQTGVGAAVGDIFVNAGLWPVRVSITGGSEVTGVGTWERPHWHVAKTVLISTVDAMLHTGVLRFAAALSEAPAMRAELLDFRRSLSAAGRASYAARTGKHDDLVLAVAIGCWFLNLPPPARAWVGSY